MLQVVVAPGTVYEKVEQPPDVPQPSSSEASKLFTL
jgi:hypothetical protein